MCLYNRLVRNPKYLPNKKNGGNPPIPNDTRTLYVPIGCGRCIECKKAKQREWIVRLLEDIKINKNASFITLTFSDQAIAELSKELPNKKGYAFDNAIATLAVRRWLERYRKKYKHSLRHWLTTELGHEGTQNIHLHGFAWFDTHEQFMNADEIWQYGKILKGQPIWERNKIIAYKNYVNQSTIMYITKYVSKMDYDHKEYNQIILTSPGIGGNYLNRTDATKNKYEDTNTKEYYKTEAGHKIALPIYYRNKLYTDEEKEKLWINKLDEQVRYVLGAKIDISKTLDDYNNTLDYARAKNIRLGYQTNIIDTDRKEYENKLRLILQETRKIKGKNKSKK
nr:MAG: replication initiator protein [Microviridae sp.]